MRRAPKHLSDEARQIWREVNSKWDLQEHELAILKTGLEAFDRMNTARKLIEKHGLVYVTNTQNLRKNPACDLECKARTGFLAAFRQLGLEVPDEEKRRPGRPITNWG
jgi:P27 family predicted phage terminase small subunit